MYENAPEADWLDEEIGVMEARLQALKGKITSDLEQLEAKLAAHQKDLKERKENLASYQLEGKNNTAISNMIQPNILP